MKRKILSELFDIPELFEQSMDDERRDNSENNVSPRTGNPEGGGGGGRGSESSRVGLSNRGISVLSVTIARKMGDTALRKFPLVLHDGR